MTNNTIDLSKITDVQVREALELLYAELLYYQPILRGDWEFREFEVEGAGTHDIKHNLKFEPIDIILLNYIGDVPTFNYDGFDGETISVTTAGDSTFRCFLGRYADF